MNHICSVRYGTKYGSYPTYDSGGGASRANSGGAQNTLHELDNLLEDLNSACSGANNKSRHPPKGFIKF